MLTRIERSAAASRPRIAGMSVPLLVVRIVRRFMDVRVMGLAAEMTYYAILSVFPIVGALGAGLGFIERVAGPNRAAAAERAILSGIDAIFAAQVTQDVFVPLVQGLMRQERAGFALGSLLITVFLASRIFRSAIHTLDVAYRVEERRGTLALWGLGFLFSAGALLTATAILAMFVVGPLLGGAHAVAGWLGLGGLSEAAWAFLRWPVVFLVCAAFLATLYRFGPNVRNRWRETMPGAVFGVAATIAVSMGFRVYLGIVGVESPALAGAGEMVSISAQVIGAGLASLLWIWLTSMVLLMGGVLNAEISQLREEA